MELHMNKPLILWGGTDINPNIYNQQPMPQTQRPDTVRDIKEINAFNLAVNKGQPIIGVCRGAQLICALQKGTLIQHSVPSRQDHSITTKGGEVFEDVSASHHQIMQPQGNYELLAWDSNSTKAFYIDGSYKIINCTPEVIWYPEIKALCIQAHPEWNGRSDFVQWVDKKLVEYNIDFSFEAFNRSEYTKYM